MDNYEQQYTKYTADLPDHIATYLYIQCNSLYTNAVMCSYLFDQRWFILSCLLHES